MGLLLTTLPTKIRILQFNFWLYQYTMYHIPPFQIQIRWNMSTNGLTNLFSLRKLLNNSIWGSMTLSENHVLTLMDHHVPCQISIPNITCYFWALFQTMVINHMGLSENMAPPNPLHNQNANDVWAVSHLRMHFIFHKMIGKTPQCHPFTIFHIPCTKVAI